jgi:8-oxo-dGTP diphosphatase
MPKLGDYPRPHVAVDVAVLTVLPSSDCRRGPGRLAVLVHDRNDTPRGPALPGRFLRQGETIADCVTTALREKTGLSDIDSTPRLLRLLDATGRDPRAWTLSLAHSVALPPRRVESAVGRFEAITTHGTLQARVRLLFDHDVIVAEAAADIRERYEHRPDPDGLLDHPFTLADLKQTHEAVLGERVRRDTFRRRMEPNLAPHLRSDGSQDERSDGGRPARLWVTADDPKHTTQTQRRLQLPRA